MAAPHCLDKLAVAKHRARVAARAARMNCDPAVGALLAEHVLAGLSLRPDAAVAGFWPLAGEIDIRPLLLALHERGHPVMLPVTPPLGQPLSFRRWHPDAVMTLGRFGTWAPEDGAEMTPDLVLVPLLAFDRKGRRLGYGGGYYDRTLAGLPRVRTLGCAFAAQELDVVPAGDYDARLHTVATEGGLIVCKGW